jgi:hypothetical protein
LAARGAGAAAPKITGHTIPQGELLMAPEPFVLRIHDAAITDLKSRLSGTRFPDSAPGEHGPTAAASIIFATSSPAGRMISIGALRKQL